MEIPCFYCNALPAECRSCPYEEEKHILATKALKIDDALRVIRCNRKNRCTKQEVTDQRIKSKGAQQ